VLHCATCKVRTGRGLHCRRLRQHEARGRRVLAQECSGCCRWVGDQARPHLVHQSPWPAFAAQGVLVLTPLPSYLSLPPSRTLPPQGHNMPGVECVKAPAASKVRGCSRTQRQLSPRAPHNQSQTTRSVQCCVRIANALMMRYVTKDCFSDTRWHAELTCSSRGGGRIRCTVLDHRHCPW
jgi:hypothetical protein